jgi:hypothetical protein
MNTQITVDEIRNIIHDLRCVKDFGEFPKGRNHLYIYYLKCGYVYMGGKTKEGYLTPKSKVKLTKKGYTLLKATPDVI